MVKSDFVTTTDLELCINCGNCEIWCNFGARFMDNDKLQLNSKMCFGCGICISKCPNEAISLNKKS